MMIITTGGLTVMMLVCYLMIKRRLVLEGKLKEDCLWRGEALLVMLWSER